jgi:hypothetical protein
MNHKVILKPPYPLLNPRLLQPKVKPSLNQLRLYRHQCGLRRVSVQYNAQSKSVSLCLRDRTNITHSANTSKMTSVVEPAASPRFKSPTA